MLKDCQTIASKIIPLLSQTQHSIMRKECGQSQCELNVTEAESLGVFMEAGPSLPCLKFLGLQK